jgi:hypothetical protein
MEWAEDNGVDYIFGLAGNPISNAERGLAALAITATRRRLGTTSFNISSRLAAASVNSPAKPPALPERIEAVLQLRE